MDRARRAFLTGAAGLAVASLGTRASGQRAGERFTPEMFGAKGDGVTNDSLALAALAERVNAAGGGRVRFRRGATYLVGVQTQAGASGADYAFEPAPLLQFEGCTKPLVLEGNGARIKCAPGLRFGTFDPVSGAPTSNAMPYFGAKELATPYRYMIMATRCTGPFSIRDLELDGSLPELIIGGPYGDTGWQIAASGIFLLDNRGDEIIRNVHSHHHPQDGLMIGGVDEAALAPRVTRRIDNLRSEYNGRQGCSIVGGRGYAFRGCKFNHTGRAGLVSAPAAGVDIEAEGGKINRDFSFVDCEFANNQGCGLLADSGDSEGARFSDCSFIGTTNWSLWPFKPNFRFDRCTIVGTAVKCHGDPDPARAAQFRDCVFRDDPALSPTGEVYKEGRADGPIVDLSDFQNILFERCAFIVEHGAVLPWSLRAIFADCVMRQTSATQAYPRGTYRGRSRITGNVDLYSSKIEGEVLLNGKRLAGVQL